MSQKKQTIEELISRLEEVTREIENPDTGVEHSIKLYEEGLKIAGQCKKRLEGARQTMETIMSAPTEKQKPEPPAKPAASPLFDQG